MNSTSLFSKYSRIFIKTMLFLFFVFVFLISLTVQGQQSSKVSLNEELYASYENPYKIISFGEKINFGKIENSIVWTVSSNDSNKKSSLIGNEINNYIFESPGTYKITFNENKAIKDGECNHTVFPEVMLIKVSPYKMDFDFSTIQFSTKLEAGAPIENCLLTVDVHLKSFSNEKVAFQNGKFVSAGIDTTIEGQLLNNAFTLNPGINKLVYQLKGVAKSGNFIMLDFFDINGQVQSYYYPTKL